MDFAHQIIFVSAFLLMFSVFAGMISSRVGAPLLLAFLGAGMLFGEDGLVGIVFNDMQTAYLVTSLALAIILFDGGLRTPMYTFRLSLWPATSLATLGVVITMGITGIFASWLLNLPLLYGLMFGAVLASTDAAAVFLLLYQQGVKLKERIRAVLEVESGINDPMAILLVIGLVEAMLAPHDYGWLSFAGIFVRQMVIGGLVGYAGGRLLTIILNRIKLAAGLYPVMALSGSLLVYSGAMLLEGSGFLAVYLAGLIMGNTSFRYKEFTKRFYDGVAWLAQIVMFLMIGLLVTPSELPQQLVPSILIAIVLIFVARPAATFLCLAPFSFSLREKTFISWVGLRGGVPIVLALIPALAEVDNSRTYFNTAFVVVALSLVLQGWTIFAAAKWLGLHEEEQPNAPADA